LPQPAPPRGDHCDDFAVPRARLTMAMRVILAVVFAVAGVVCWLLPGAIGAFLFHSLRVGVHESMIIGALFFIGAAILLFIRPPDENS